LSLDIVVCVKIVPKPEEVTFNAETKTLDRGKAENVLNAADKNALEVALELRAKHGGTVSVVSMGPPFARGHLDLCVGMGADRGLLASDRLFAGADTFPTSLVLARAAQKLGHFDLVLCGEESADSATGQVPSGVAEWLGVPQVTSVEELQVEGHNAVAKRDLGSSWEIVAAPLPALIAVVSGANQPRFPRFKLVDESAKAGRVRVMSAADLGLAETEVGLKGSHTIVEGLVAGESVERKHRFVEGTTKEKAKELARVLAPFVKARSEGQ